MVFKRWRHLLGRGRQGCGPGRWHALFLVVVGLVIAVLVDDQSYTIVFALYALATVLLIGIAPD